MPSDKARDQRAHTRLVVCAYCGEWGPLKGPGGNLRAVKLIDHTIYIHDRCGREWRKSLGK